MNLNDLPDEMLDMIFDQLDVHELKLASLVCRRWSELTFSGRRMDRVLLVNRNSNCEIFINSKRNYRNVHQPPVTMMTKYDQIESLVRLLHTIRPHVRMFVMERTDIECYITSEQLGSILLEVPTIQDLSIGLAEDQCNTNGTFPVLPKLESLLFNGTTNDSFVLSCTHIAKWQCIEMDCRTDLELEAWTYFSGQLKLVHVHSLHPFLRRLSIYGMMIPVEWVESISQHCPELTHLALFLKNAEEGLLESLVQLSKLKHLSLNGEVDRKILLGPMKSLESVELKMYPRRVVLENLFDVVPRLRCLAITEFISYDDLQFIYDNFLCLRRLEVYIDDEVSIVADDSVRFDRLEHLQELKVSDNIRIRSIHRNNVRCMTITHRPADLDSRSGIMNSDLDWIPQKFPLLNRLILEECSVSLAAVEQLHNLVPSCRIDYDNKRF